MIERFDCNKYECYQMPEGEYVQYSDHAAEIAKARKVIEDAREIIKSLTAGTLTPIVEREIKAWGRIWLRNNEEVTE